MNKLNLKKGKNSNNLKTIIATIAVCLITIGTIAPVPFFASDPKTTNGFSSTIDSLFGVAESGFTALYNGVLKVITVAAVAICGWCFLVKMFSKNPRSIDEANQWMKRVAIAWLCFMLLSIFVRIGKDIITTTTASTTSPWQ